MPTCEPPAMTATKKGHNTVTEDEALEQMAMAHQHPLRVPGLCGACDCYYDAPRVEGPDPEGVSDFYCPHCGDHYAHWPEGEL